MSTGKSDLERLGYFSEPGYISKGDKYVTRVVKPFVDSHFSGKQFTISANKSGHDSLDAYFDHSFKRVFQGEAYSDSVSTARKQRREEAKKQLGKPFRPSGVIPKPSGSGDHFGTFSGPIPAVSGVSEKVPYKSPGKNFLVSPAKRGTGYGYPGVGIGPDVAYTSEAYNLAQEKLKEEMRIHKSKMIAKAFIPTARTIGLFSPHIYTDDKALPPPKRESVTPPALQKHPFRPSHPAKSGIWGCLNHYPTHSSEGLPKKTSAVKSVKEKGKRFIMNGGTKSTPIRSVVCMNVPLRQSAYKLSTYA